MARWIEGLDAARSYRREWLRRDVIAGLSLSALLVPQGMAYATLAQLPPVTGLYTTVIVLIGYAAFGPSRILVVGPDSALGPLIAATIVPLLGAGGDPDKAVALAGMLAILMGLVAVGAGFARAGALAELLSKPVRIGYLNGIAVIVIVSQLPKLFGFSTDADGLLDEATAFAAGVADGSTVPAALVIGLASIAVIVASRRLFPAAPGVLVAVVGATLATGALDLATHGVPVVGPVPEGFPSPSIPSVALDDLGPLAIAAAGMAFVTLADTMALSRTFARRRGETADPNREIFALGMTNMAAGLFQGFPVSGSSSRTAVAWALGSRSQLTGVVGALCVVAVLVFANGITRNMPDAVLAAIVIVAAFTLFDFEEMSWLWRVRRSEFFLAAAALTGVAVVGVLEGILVAIVLSLGNFVRRAWRPHDAVLGRMERRKGYHDVERHPDARQVPGLLIYRFDAPIFFANADYFDRRLRAGIAARGEPVRWIVVAAEPVTDIDTTGAEMLHHLLDDLESRGIVLAFAELKGPVKDRLRRYGLYERIGEARFLPTLGLAIDVYLEHTGVDWVDWTDRIRDEPADAPSR